MRRQRARDREAGDVTVENQGARERLRPGQGRGRCHQ
jgi:hypothetical protein